MNQLKQKALKLLLLCLFATVLFTAIPVSAAEFRRVLVTYEDGDDLIKVGSYYFGITNRSRSKRRYSAAYFTSPNRKGKRIILERGDYYPTCFFTDGKIAYFQANAKSLNKKPGIYILNLKTGKQKLICRTPNNYFQFYFESIYNNNLYFTYDVGELNGSCEGFVGKLDLNTRKMKLLFRGNAFEPSPDNRYIHCYSNDILLIYDCKKEKIVRSIKPDLGEELMADVFLYVSEDWAWFTATDTITYETTHIFRYPTKGKLYYEQVAVIDTSTVLDIKDKYVLYETDNGLFHRYSFDTGKSIVVSRQDVIKKYGIRL